MKPRVSIAMATYNGSAFLREQLNSLISQTIIPDEIVIVDDASTDETRVLIDQFSKTSPATVRVYHNTVNKGVIESFGAALPHCNGDIIFFSDQDDVWHEGKIAHHLEKYECHPDAGFVFSNSRLVSEDGAAALGQLWDIKPVDVDDWVAMSEIERLLVLIRHRIVYGHALSFRACYKELILPFGCYEFTHDVWISIVLTALGHGGVMDAATLVDYRQHKHQVAGATFRGRMNGQPETRKEAAARREHLSRDFNAAARHVEALAGATVSVDLLDAAASYNAKRSAIAKLGVAAGIRAIFSLTFGGQYKRFGSSHLSTLSDFAGLMAKGK